MDYTIGENITNELLLNNEFRKVIYKNGTKQEYEYIYTKYLINDVYMSVSIYVENNIMTLDSIKVIDDNFGLPYQPFYQNQNFEAVNIVKEKYNNEISKLVNLGILKSNEKVLKREMK